jgi:biotin carboxyl carrier protein
VQGHAVVAPMPGKILSIGVQLGDQVTEGDIVCTLEAMKMEMPIGTTSAGTVKAIHVRVGESVANDAPLVTIG